MGKVLDWLLGMTKVGKVLGSVQTWLSGKKTYLAGSALIVPALVTIVTKFADQGAGYLLHVAGTPEWEAFMAGLGLMGLRAAVSKSGTDSTTTPPAA